VPRAAPQDGATVVENLAVSRVLRGCWRGVQQAQMASWLRQ
jgi:hypothetical protein